MSKIASQFIYSHKDIAKLLMKDADIHEGIWNLSFGFRMGAGVFGESKEQSFPTGFIGIESLVLQRVEEKPEGELPPMLFDASELNPKP